jgi:hypothetical protein
MRQQVNLEIGFGLEEFAALVTDAGARSSLSVDLAQVTTKGGSRREHGRTGFARMMSATARQ